MRTFFWFQGCATRIAFNIFLKLVMKKNIMRHMRKDVLFAENYWSVLGIRII
jgi:hypothetical protein